MKADRTMIVHRFMSETEYEGLMAGGKLMNGTIHAEQGKKENNFRRVLLFCGRPRKSNSLVEWNMRP